MLTLKRSNGYYVEREVSTDTFVWPTGTIVFSSVTTNEGLTESTGVTKNVTKNIIIPRIIIPTPTESIQTASTTFYVEKDEVYEDTDEDDYEDGYDNRMDCDYSNPETFWGLTWDNVTVNRKKANELTKEKFDQEQQSVNHTQRMLEWEEIHCRCRACQDFGVTCCLFFPDHEKSRQNHKRKMASVLDQLVLD